MLFLVYGQPDLDVGRILELTVYMYMYIVYYRDVKSYFGLELSKTIGYNSQISAKNLGWGTESADVLDVVLEKYVPNVLDALFPEKSEFRNEFLIFVIL